MADPSEALKNLLSPVALSAMLFAANSRYSGIDTAVYQAPGSPPVRYLRRRFVPLPELFTEVQEHLVKDRDRLDNLANLYFTDPELFWRIADANRAMRPEALTETPGVRLRITLPQGVPAPTPL
jgi:hypothetical protein